VVGRVVGKRSKADKAGSGKDTAEDRRANVNAAVKMNTGKPLDDE
jgi:4-carboxymuconolactone decarboxylase